MNLNKEIEELQAKIDASERTDHLTLPVPPPPFNEERAKASDIERKAILSGKPEDVADASGRTNKQVHEQLFEGKMPEGAPKSAKDSVGKHEVSVQGNKVIVKSPHDDKDVVISIPYTEKGDAPPGSELMYSTPPTPESTQDAEPKDVAPVPKKESFNDKKVMEIDKPAPPKFDFE